MDAASGDLQSRALDRHLDDPVAAQIDPLDERRAAEPLHGIRGQPEFRRGRLVPRVLGELLVRAEFADAGPLEQRVAEALGEEVQGLFSRGDLGKKLLEDGRPRPTQRRAHRRGIVRHAGHAVPSRADERLHDQRVTEPGQRPGEVIGRLDEHGSRKRQVGPLDEVALVGVFEERARRVHARDAECQDAPHGRIRPVEVGEGRSRRRRLEDHEGVGVGQCDRSPHVPPHVPPQRGGQVRVEVVPVRHDDVVATRGEHRFDLVPVHGTVVGEDRPVDVSDSDDQSLHESLRTGASRSTSTGRTPPPREMFTMSPSGAYRER